MAVSRTPVVHFLSTDAATVARATGYAGNVYLACMRRNASNLVSVTPSEAFYDPKLGRLLRRKERNAQAVKCVTCKVCQKALGKN